MQGDFVPRLRSGVAYYFAARDVLIAGRGFLVCQVLLFVPHPLLASSRRLVLQSRYFALQ